ncbi:MAG TPA: 2-oxoacid:acceptor oxidoreductase subunit alpha [Alphaproteobacteria bacterium]|jgi:2-oxoglutarate ferredoxin oxidoreductase subunit alpha|nr:2-oxoacid:acceptor oxidoreductase subunit alpha [Alphaproteobacteria bacterium]
MAVIAEETDVSPVLTEETWGSAVIRFAGDSGDGMQLTGSQFMLASAVQGNALATFPDFPAEIRAPAGTTFGVSAYQINFSAQKVLTAGDTPDVLVAMNPAALKTNLTDLPKGSMLVVDTGSFTERNLRKAGYKTNPIEDDSLEAYHVMEVDMSQATLNAVAESGLGQKEGLRCKNMWALGLVMWLFERKRAPTIDWLRNKFSGQQELAEANIAALNAGHAWGETAELPHGFTRHAIPRADIEPGLYRAMSGSEALAWGLAIGCDRAGLEMMLGSYPITPASPLLHILAGLKSQGVTTFQAEDEIAAVCSAIGASYAGKLGVTTSSGPGVALKTEALGLAVMVELPLILVNSQRAGPSTGMPTKTEQSDLMQAVYGRNGDTPLPVLAAYSPANCFDMAIEAVRIATRYMTPVILLTDGYLSNAAEPWRIPDIDTLPRFPVTFHTEVEGFEAYMRDPETLARPWAIPGTLGLEHRVGGIEKEFGTGNISYDPKNHQRMTNIRAAKVAGIANGIAPQSLAYGPSEGGELAVVGWGSTFGAIDQAVRGANDAGKSVAHIHLTHLNPFPANLEDLLKRFRRVLVPEMNTGQLSRMLRGEFLLPVKELNKVNGQPFKVAEIAAAIDAALENNNDR